MFERFKHSSHLPERDPKLSDYDGVDGVEIVHLKLDSDGANAREVAILERINKLRSAGVSVHEVDIETPIEGTKKIVVGGVLGDVCVPKRRRFLIDHGHDAKIDPSLTSDY